MDQSDGKISKQDRRIFKSQEAIKAAMIELMSEKDFDGITIQDIADRANVSRGTVYLHYTDKFDLVTKLISAHMRELYILNKSTAESDHVHRTFLWVKYFEQNYMFFSTMLSSKCSYFLHSQFMDLLATLTKYDLNVTDLKSRGINEDIMIHFIGSAIAGLIEWWISQGMPVSPQVLAEQLGMLIDKNLKPDIYTNYEYNMSF